MTNCEFQVRQEFDSVLQTQKISACISKNKSTLYRLLGEHGAKENLIRLADIMDDHDKQVELYSQVNGYITFSEVFFRGSRINRLILGLSMSFASGIYPKKC
jgi:hypothetical protein